MNKQHHKFYFILILLTSFLSGCSLTPKNTEVTQITFGTEGLSGTTTAYTTQNEWVGAVTQRSAGINFHTSTDTDTVIRWGYSTGNYPYVTNTSSATTTHEVVLGTGTASNPYITQSSTVFYLINYRVDDDGTQTDISKTLSPSVEKWFVSAPKATSTGYRFLVWADSQGANDQVFPAIESVFAPMMKAHTTTPKFILHAGDFMSSSVSPFTTQAQADNYWNLMRAGFDDLTGYFPIMDGVGNHNEESSNATSLYVGAKARKRSTYIYPEPQNAGVVADTTNEESYYSFTWGDALYLILDENRSGGESMTDAELTWVDQMLSTTDKHFKFVVGHYPLRAEGTFFDDPEAVTLKGHLEAHGVTAYFSGHIHGQNFTQENGVWYLNSSPMSTINNSGSYEHPSEYPSGLTNQGWYGSVLVGDDCTDTASSTASCMLWWDEDGQETEKETLMQTGPIVNDTCPVGYTYSKTISFTNPSSTAKFDVALQLDLDSTNLNFDNIESDCDDMRFIPSNSHNFTSYELESCGASTAQVFVEIPAIAGSAEDYLTMCYGNDYVVSESDATSTWDGVGDMTILGDVPDEPTCDSTVENYNGWYDLSWPFREKITIASGITASDLVGFPVLVTSTPSLADIFARAQTDGEDILFTSSDGVTKLDHDLVKYDPGSDEFYTWVETDLSSSANTDLYLYYGNPIACAQATSTGVWTSFEAVYHFNETTGNYLDATANNHDITTQNRLSTTTSPTWRAPTFDGTIADYLLAPDSARLVGANWTIEALFNRAGNGVLNNCGTGCTNMYPIVTKGNGQDETPATNVQWQLGTEANAYISASFEDTGTLATTSNAVSVTSNSVWYYGATQIEGDVNMDVQLNDSANNSHMILITPNPDNGAPLCIAGSCNTVPAVGAAWNGAVGEVRISTSVRSDAWLNASYRTIFSGRGYMTYGTEENAPSTAQPRYKKVQLKKGIFK